MPERSAAYWEGMRAEEKRLAERDAARAYAADAAAIARNLRRDEAVKQRILARSPALAFAIDAVEAAGMSAAELATRELKDLGITPKNSDPVELLDAHHAGREHARNLLAAQGLKWAGDGGRRARSAYSGQALDGSDLEGTDFVSRHIRGEK